jgi:hypothetical protein
VMSSYINLKTMEYPCHEGDIRLKFPEIPEELTGDLFPILENYALVRWTEPPNFNSDTEYFCQTVPQQIDGNWCMVWEKRNFTEKELEEQKKIREKQEELRKSSLSGQPISDVRPMPPLEPIDPSKRRPWMDSV